MTSSLYIHKEYKHRVWLMGEILGDDGSMLVEIKSPIGGREFLMSKDAFFEYYEPFNVISYEGQFEEKSDA